MKSLSNYIEEKLIVNRNYRLPKKIVVSTWRELRELILKRYDKQGPGTKNEPIYFNDVDVSNINSFYQKGQLTPVLLKSSGVFEQTKFKYIDISDWEIKEDASFCCMFKHSDIVHVNLPDMTNVRDFSYMFECCKNLEEIDDFKIDTSTPCYLRAVFKNCWKLKKIPLNLNLKSKIKINARTEAPLSSMFFNCRSLDADVIKTYNIDEKFLHAESGILFT